MAPIKWYIKQMLPLTYISELKIEKKLCVWKMWLGKSYKIRWFDLK